MNQPLRIGARSSPLALFQAEAVLHALAPHPAVLIPSLSAGDLTLDRALSSFGGEGVFTKALDEALLRGEVDLAVHSCKDIPTDEDPDLYLAAMLPRADVRDVLIGRVNLDWLTRPQAVIATGSTRRRAQWLQRHPNHQLVDLRGNIQTRLQKLAAGDWDGAIFAAAALERLGLTETLTLMMLDWMLPAAAQGAIAIVARRADAATLQLLEPLNHLPTWQSVQAEREFLRRMECGCSAPVAAYAWFASNNLCFQAKLLHPDGSRSIDIEVKVLDSDWQTAAPLAAEQALALGAADLVRLYKQK